MLANPLCGFHFFDLALARNRRAAGRVALSPDQPPWPVLVREGDRPFVGIVFFEAPLGIIAGADVKTAGGILQDVNPENAVGRFQTRQVGLEPTTSRLIPTRRDSTIELASQIQPRNSAGRTRTYNQPVNSRLLYH